MQMNGARCLGLNSAEVGVKNGGPSLRQGRQLDTHAGPVCPRAGYDFFTVFQLSFSHTN
jgi:hypothetical protein